MTALHQPQKQHLFAAAELTDHGEAIDGRCFACGYKSPCGTVQLVAKRLVARDREIASKALMAAAQELPATPDDLVSWGYVQQWLLHRAEHITAQ